jgi:hypothetical protein
MDKRTGLPYAIYVPDLILEREPRTAFLNVACGPKTRLAEPDYAAPLRPAFTVMFQALSSHSGM